MQDGPASPRTLRLHANDNIIVAVDGLMPGVTAHETEATARILKGHKMAVTKIEKGAPILKFGQIIGFAEDPNYRAYTEATSLLFMNAVLLGPGR